MSLYFLYKTRFLATGISFSEYNTCLMHLKKRPSTKGKKKGFYLYRTGTSEKIFVLVIHESKQKTINLTKIAEKEKKTDLLENIKWPEDTDSSTKFSSELLGLIIRNCSYAPFPPNKIKYLKRKYSINLSDEEIISILTHHTHFVERVAREIKECSRPKKKDEINLLSKISKNAKKLITLCQANTRKTDYEISCIVYKNLKPLIDALTVYGYETRQAMEPPFNKLKQNGSHLIDENFCMDESISFHNFLWPQEYGQLLNWTIIHNREQLLQRLNDFKILAYIAEKGKEYLSDHQGNTGKILQKELIQNAAQAYEILTSKNARMNSPPTREAKKNCKGEFHEFLIDFFKEIKNIVRKSLNLDLTPKKKAQFEKFFTVENPKYNPILLSQDSTEFPEESEIFIRKINDYTLEYTVMIPTKNIVTKQITQKELGRSIKKKFTPEQLQKLLPHILKITVKRRHTTKPQLFEGESFERMVREYLYHRNKKK